MSIVHRSKVDAWLLVVLVLVVVVPLFASAVLLADGSAAAWVALPLVAPGAVLPAWLLLGTRYVLQLGLLTVRCGPFAWRVPLAEVTGMHPTRNPLSSPALSLDRLRIDYGVGRSIMVSPRDRARFVEDLERLRAGAGRMES
ncbi:PH domain-containing protein [Coralloluteibacterium thermophilus]|uniref:PH domain-containing protein n=1 Tax=Coralloluteibacterium thermophilum TaxID=2707049 RepID=A0ABV9NKU8_9GAMM